MTVPDFLRVRYEPPPIYLSALSLAVMMTFISGISLYAISSLLHMFFGWRFFNVAIVGSGAILCYSLAGGLQGDDLHRNPAIHSHHRRPRAVDDPVFRDFHGIHGILQKLAPWT